MNIRSCVKSLFDSKTFWLSVLIPLAALPLPLLYPNSVARCGYCVIVTGLFWVTEIIPLAATSLFPVFLFPMFGIMTAKEVCMSYVKDTLMLFLGSLIVAVAVERWNLHRRLALRTLTLVGPQPRWLLLGVMFPCWFLSMWMSNTATTAMMMPILTAILHQIRDSRRLSRQVSEDEEDGDVRIIMQSAPGKDEDDAELNTALTRKRPEQEKEDREFLSLAKTFALSTAFSANIGGMATLTGTPPNVIFKGLADTLYQKHGVENPINFASWLIIGVPLSFVCFIFCWFWMQLYGQGLRCFRCCAKDDSFSAVKRVLQAEYRKLGSMTFAEGLVLTNFIILAVLWITRDPGFIPGWSLLFEDGFVKDSTPAILISVLLFILPARPPRWLPCCRSKADAIHDALQPVSGYQAVLNWKIVNDKMAWGVLLLMGGGFALADGCQKSGLSLWVSEQLAAMSDLPDWVVSVIMSLFIALATEVTSNSATTTLFVPVAGDLAIQLGVNPLYFMIPCTIAASLAFLLPVATPPNAIVFASGYLTVKDMFLVGLPMNIFALVALNIATSTWVAAAFDLFNTPGAFLTNSTFVLNATSGSLDISVMGVLNLNSTVMP